MSNAKRVAKLSEFIAHSSDVTCCTIGRKCNRIAATGGEDMKVNLWTLARPTCIMSLTGHTSPVSNITFSPNEDKIVSGSSSGSIKVWDLEANKLICNLVGHKSNVTCLEYHAYADYVASGSIDSQIRLWDLRRKGCIFTYKGHTEGVNALKFSPDSKWIASAAGDKLVKIWDLKAGRLLTNLEGHEAGINSLEFHPNEFLLATGSSDRTVKYWDLEKMQVVSTSPQSLTAISVIIFEQNGKCLFASCNDYLLSLSWEPSELHDSIYCQWKHVSDMTTYSNKLLAATCHKNSVSFHAVDLLQVPPIGVFHGGGDSEATKRSVNHPPSSSAVSAPPVSNLKGGSINSSRKNFHHVEKLEPSEQQDDETSLLQQIQNQKDMIANSDNSQASIYDQDAYNKIFRNLKENDSSISVEPSAYDNAQTPVKKVIHSPPVHNPSVNQVAASPSHKLVSSPAKHVMVTPEIIESPKQANKPLVVAKNSPDLDAGFKQLNINDFMPKPDNQARLNAFDFVTTIENGHDAFMKAIKSRQMNLNMVRSLWTNGNVKSALDTAVSLNDITIMADILNQLTSTPHVWTLDIVTILLPSIKSLIGSKYEDHMHVGTESCKIVLKNFGKVIRANVMPDKANVGVDICREERQRKCNSCYSYLVDITQIIANKTPETNSSRLLNNFREINLLMKTLDN